MDPLLATLVLILLALLGARFSFSTERVPAGPRLLFRTGTHFLLLGFLLGPSGLELFSRSALDGLFPLLGLGLGWIGLLFGLQLDRPILRRFPRPFYVLAIGQSVLTLLIVGGVALAALRLAGVGGDAAVALALGAAATASVSTPAGIAMVSSNFLVRGNVRLFLFFAASFDGIVGIVAIHFVYAYLHGSPVLVGPDELGLLFWSLMGVGLGLLCGIVFLWLIRLRPAREELVLYLLGLSALAAGSALQLQLSPLFVSMVLGTVVAQMAPPDERARVYQALSQWEKPIYVVLLLLTGALLRFPTWWIAPLTLGYVLVRGIAKVAGSAALVTLARPPFSPPRRMGLGLVPQGGLALAMALSLELTLGRTDVLVAGWSAVDLLFAMLVIGVVLSELVGPMFTIQVLRRAGEISPRVEKALEEGDEARARAEALRHAPSVAGPPEPGGGAKP